ncbi:MAG: heavy-metal-associated domain-containing protein [Hyphomicrobiaceae bacterium]|nr:MAG: heavy-metal-associated domain-containing protein [Hyphomicrobiaceae bacterium]
MKTATFNIDGMHCDACASNTKSLVESEPEVRMVSVSFKEGRARVYDPQAVGEERLIAAIQSPGLRVVDRTSAGEDGV